MLKMLRHSYLGSQNLDILTVSTPRIRSGFTLIEMMLAMAIFAFVLVGWMSVMLHSFRLVQHSDMRIEAVNEAQTVMNLIRSANTDPDNFPEIVTNAFPAGVLSPARDTLPGQVVTISYQNTNPLTVTVAVQYTENNGRTQTETLSTLLSNF